MEHSFILLSMAAVSGFFMAWAVGANDVANTMGTSVGSKVLTIRQAIVVAGIFEALGAMLASGQVTNTIRNGMLDIHVFASQPDILVYGMLAALLAAATWLVTATHFGWPVSTTHSIVGAVIGFALVSVGSHHVKWAEVINIFLSWVVTPIISGLLSYGLFKSVQRLILTAKNSLQRAERYVPVYIFLVAMVVSLVTFFEGLEPLGKVLSPRCAFLASVGCSVVCAMLGRLWMHKLELGSRGKKIAETEQYSMIERIFGVLAIFTACAMGFAHGSNDVANAIGPLAAIISVIQQGGNVSQAAPIPFWLICLGAVGVVTGLAMYGYKVIATVGTNITKLTPSRGFAAQLATASTVILSSGLGLPVSTTQTLVGAVLGVGLAGGIGALNLQVVRNIFMSWVITLPAGAGLAIVFFYVIRFSLGA